MSYRKFSEEIKKGLPSSSYMFVSSGSFLLKEAVSLVKDLVPREERDFNFHVFDLLATGNGGTPFEYIIDVLNTVPFFSGRKYVIIDNFQKITQKPLKKLEQYLANPAESSVMILLYEGSVKKTVADKLKGVKHIPVDIREKEIPSWLKERAASSGLEISDGALDYLLGTIGPELGMLVSELDKFKSIGKAKIEKKDIVGITGGNRTYSPFDLVNAIRAKDTEKVFRIYRVLSSTEEPYSLLGVLNWQFRQSASGKDTAEGRAYACRVFNVLNEADLHIKSSGSPYPMELLLVRLLRISKLRT
ncbi:MAG: DNA polymerase III subunit delta [Nitrospirota bacterium]|nr:DNA polymerase III subunit delta [Nitrospirota bacterium]